MAKKIKLSVTIIIITIILAVALAAFFILYPKDSEDEYTISEDVGFTLKSADRTVISVRELLKKHSEKIKVTFSSEGEYFGDMNAFVSDLMDLAMDDTDDPKEGDYIRMQTGGYTVTYNQEQKGSRYVYHIEIEPVYYSSVRQEKKVDELVSEIVDDLELGSDDISDLEKVRRVHDYLKNNVKYDKVHENKDNNHLKGTAYAALAGKAAVCQGYSVAMYRLLAEAHISSRVIKGYAESPDGKKEYHAWNIVQVGDLYYNVDVTWDAMRDTDEYFLKGDMTFADHERDPEYKTDAFMNTYVMSAKDHD